MTKFFQFIDKIHLLTDYYKGECDLGTYVGCLKGVLLNPEKSYEDKRSFFTSHSINYTNVFRSMSNLKKNEEYAITLLEGLKYLRDNNKSIGKKAGQKRQYSSPEHHSEGKLRVILDEIEEATKGEQNETNKCNEI